MIQCDGCGRHLRTADSTCPFCAAPARSGLATKLLLTAGAILTPVVLAACYGGAPFDDSGELDTDPQDTDGELDTDQLP